MGNTSSQTNKPPDEPKLYTREEALQIYIEADNLEQARHLLIRNSHLLLLQCLPQGFDNNIAHELWTFTGDRRLNINECVPISVKDPETDTEYIDKKSAKTALMKCVKLRRMKIMDFVLQHSDLDINIKDWFGKTALMMACEDRSYDIVETLLVTKYMRPNVSTGVGITPLMYACKKLDFKIIDLLIKHKRLDINAVDNAGWSALMYNAKYGNDFITKVLLELGANVNIKNNDGDTALLIASRESFFEISDLLLTVSGVDTTIKDIYGYTVEDYYSMDVGGGDDPETYPQLSFHN